MIKFYRCSYSQYMNGVVLREKVQTFYTLNFNSGWSVDQFVTHFLQLNQNRNFDKTKIRQYFTQILERKEN